MCHFCVHYVSSTSKSLSTTPLSPNMISTSPKLYEEVTAPSQGLYFNSFIGGLYLNDSREHFWCCGIPSPVLTASLAAKSTVNVLK